MRWTSTVELLRKAEPDGDIDFLRESVRVLAQELMELADGGDADQR
jgi:hypothetical protein